MLGLYPSVAAMLYLFCKAALSGVIIAAVSELSRRSPSLGGLLASLPLISLLGILWLWKDTGDNERIAAHAYATFWFVLPSLPMFLILPALLRHGCTLWLSLLISCTITIVLYATMCWLLARMGISL